MSEGGATFPKIPEVRIAKDAEEVRAKLRAAEAAGNGWLASYWIGVLDGRATSAGGHEEPGDSCWFLLRRRSLCLAAWHNGYVSGLSHGAITWSGRFGRQLGRGQ